MRATPLSICARAERSTPRWRGLVLLCLLAGLGGCVEDEAEECPLDPVASPTDDADADGYPASVDCDDGSFDTNPAATETCDGIDNNCDGSTDGPESIDASTYYADLDGDGYGDDDVTVTSCGSPSNYAIRGGDCDDSDPEVNPSAAEICNNADDDCDGLTDDADPDVTGTSTWYMDADGDGYGDPTNAVDACIAPAGAVSNADDCDDTSALVNPGATETCNSVDDDCDSLIDDDDTGVTGTSTWYTDADGDGYGDPFSPYTACAFLVGTVVDATDCDDADASINPGETETVGDSEDSDCDGVELCYVDADGDGYAEESGSTTSSIDTDCSGPGEADSAAPLTDCDDADASVNPGETETVGDGVDADCDGAETCYVDADLDGYAADSGATLLSTDLDCTDSGEASASAPLTDCDDSDASISPSGTEVANDGVDTDCDGYDPATNSVWTLDACSADGGISLVVKSNGAFGACVVTGTDFNGDDPSCSWRPPLLIETDGTQHEIRTASTTNDVQLSDAEATSIIVLSGLPDLDIEIDQIVTGSTLTQTYTFTNNGATDVDFDVYRTADPDLDFGFQNAHPYSVSSPEPQPAIGSCPAGDVEYGGRCCPSFNPTCTSDLYNTRKGYPGFNVPWEIDGDPAACSYDRLADPSGGYCVAVGDGAGDATYDGYRIIMGQSNGSAIHAHLGFALGFYVQDRQESTTVAYVLQSDGSDESLSDLPQNVAAGDDLPGLGWDYAFGLGGAGDLGILLSWQLSVPAGGSATLVTTTNWYPAVTCP